MRGGPISSRPSQCLPTSAWSHTLWSHCPISSLPWRICLSHQVAYRTSPWHAFLHAAALQTSSLSEFEMSSKDKVSSSSELLSSSVFPKKTTSGEPEQYHSRLSESPKDDPVSDSDSVGLELPKLNTLELEECGLNLEPQE